MNTRAERLVEGMIDLSRKTLAFRDNASMARFTATLGGALYPDLVDETTPSACTVLDNRGRPLLMRVLSLAGVGPFLASNSAALILFAPQKLDQESVFAAKFGLTPAELRIALALSSGSSVRDIASVHGVRPESVRTQLKSVYSKTNTHRQSQLVSLVARTAVEESAAAKSVSPNR